MNYGLKNQFNIWDKMANSKSALHSLYYFLRTEFKFLPSF